MKRVLPLLLIFTLLAACQTVLPPAATPTPSDDAMSTRVAQILTAMPTPTAEVALPTQEPPKAVPTEAPLPTETLAPEPTAEPTSAPAATDTTAPEATATTSGGVPQVQITPVGPSGPAGTPAITNTPPADDPRSRLGNATWTDNLDNGDAWPKGNDQYTSIDVSGGSLKLTAESGTDGWRLSWPTVKNFYMEMTMKPGDCAGSDHYGMFVRVPEPSKADQGYLFGLTCDGRYSLRRWNARIGAKGEMKWLVNWTSSSAIVAGENQTNRLGLLAQGESLTLYVNGVKLTQVTDNTFTGEGGFGIFVGSDETEKFSIFLDQVSYWKDPNL